MRNKHQPKNNRKNKNNPIKQIVAIILTILLITNMIAIGAGYINELLFWINLMFLGAISYIFYKDEDIVIRKNV